MSASICLFLCLLICAAAPAQGIFNQNKTMLKRCAEQIALLGTYAEYAAKGYRIAKDGIATVYGFQSGELSQHMNYFNSLLAVRPGIKNYGRVKEVLSLQEQILSGCDHIIALAQDAGVLQPDERQHISGIINGLLRAVSGDIQELNDCLTEGKLSLTDDQRIARIDALYTREAGRAKACIALQLDVQRLIQGRRQQSREKDALQKLYGLPAK